MSKPSNKITLWIGKLSFKKLALFLLYSLIVFLFCYIFFFKNFLLRIISGNSDQADRDYYSAIFSNLEYAALITSFILAILFFYYRKIFSFFLSFSNKKLLITTLILNIIIQLLILAFVHTIPISDSTYYIHLSQQLYSNGSYLSEGGNPTAFWPVGLPAYLVFLKLITGNNLLLAKLMNIVFSTLCISLLFNLFKNEFSKKGKIIFLFSFMLFPNNLFGVNVMMTEYLFSFLLWLIIYISVRFNNSSIYLGLIGIISGLMSYLRPIGLLLPVIFLFYFYRNYGIKSALLKSAGVVVIMILIISPWVYRNYMVFHKFIPVSTNGGVNFLMGNHKFSSGGLNFDFEYDYKNPDEPLEEQKAYQKAFTDILDNPVQTILRIPRKIFYSYFRGDSSVTWALKSTENYFAPVFLSFIFFSTNFYFYLVILSSVFGLAKWKTIKNDKLKVLFLYVFLLIIIMVMIYVGSERYIIPLLPVHFFFFTKFVE